MEDRKIPNWCSNTLTISHEDPAQIQRFVDAAKQGRLFAEFVPLNENGDWEYGKAVDMWGTKWDISETDFEIDGKSASGYFDTAWSPPIAFYEALMDMDFEVEASYHESGMQFAGVYVNGAEEYCEYDFSDPNWRDKIVNEEIVDMLEYEYECWLDWQDEVE